MRRGIELVSIVIFVVVLASLLGGYTRGIGVPLGLSEVAAQEDHDDGGDDGGDDFDDGHDDGGDDFDDGHDDGGDDFDGGHDGGGDDFDGGHDDGGDHTGIDQHIDDAGDFIGGTEVFIGNDFQLNAGGMAADFAAGLFLDTATGQVFDIAGVQFYDPDTGEPIDLDLNSDRYARGDFDYGYDPRFALGFRGHIIGGTDIIEGGDYQTSAGGLPYDVNTGLFLNSSSNQVFDTNGVQFFDLDTGEPLEFDITADWYTSGLFDYQFVSEAALGYRGQSVAGLEVYLGGEFEQNAGGMSVDPASGLFYDPGTGQIFDNGGVQFFDPDTGEPLEFDLGSDWYTQGDFTYEYRPGTAIGFKPRVNLGFRSEEALLAYNEAQQFADGGFEHEESDVAHKIAQELDHQGFQELGSDVVFSMMEAMGNDNFHGLESSQKASIFAAMNGIQILEFDPSDVAAVAAAMSSQDYSLLDSDSAFGIFNSIGIDKSLGLGADSLAGMVGGFEGSHFHELGGDQVSEIVGGLTYEHLAGLGDEQAFNMALEMNSGHFDNLDSGQISGLTRAIDAQNIGELDGSVLEAIVTGLEAVDLLELGIEKAEAVFIGVGDNVILTLPDESKDAALDALDANFFDRGTRFNIDLPKDTIIEQLELEAPQELADLLKNVAFIRSINSIGCASAGNCTGVIDRIRPRAATFILTATSSAGGSVDPSGTTDYNAGDFVTVTATPHDGYVFVGWSGACGGDGGCTLSMDIDKTVSAEFIPIFTFTVHELPIGYLGARYLDFSFCDPRPATGLFCGGPLPINPEPTNPTGGTPHYTFSHSTGLPLGLTLNFNGVLTGTVAENSPTGTRRFDVCAHDQGGIEVCRQAEIEVFSERPRLEFSTFILPNAAVGETYQGVNFTSAVAGGVPFSTGPRYIFSHHPLIAPPPAGLTLLEDGTLTGKPEYETSTNFEICVFDFTGQSTCQFFEISVDPPPDLLSGTWSGSYSAPSIGDGGCVYNNAGALNMTISQNGSSVSGRATTDGLERRNLPSCTYAYDSTGSGSVNGSISGDTVTLDFNFNTALGSMTFRGVGILENNSINGTYLRTGRTAIKGSFTLTLQ